MSLIDSAIKNIEKIIQELNELGGASTLEEYIDCLEAMNGHTRNRLEQAYEVKEKMSNYSDE